MAGSSEPRVTNDMTHRRGGSLETGTGVTGEGWKRRGRRGSSISISRPTHGAAQMIRNEVPDGGTDGVETPEQQGRPGSVFTPSLNLRLNSENR